MAQSPDHEHCWGVILAGGEGSRLRSLTQLISGDDRPKQFCRLWGTSTLLSRTRRRIEKYFPTRRTIFVLARSHERFYREELVDVLSTCNFVDSDARCSARSTGSGHVLSFGSLLFERREFYGGRDDGLRSRRGGLSIHHSSRRAGQKGRKPASGGLKPTRQLLAPQSFLCCRSRDSGKSRRPCTPSTF